MRAKAFFINGGAGRVITSIPALEKYAETHDDFIIVAEGGMNFYKAHTPFYTNTHTITGTKISLKIRSKIEIV